MPETCRDIYGNKSQLLHQAGTSCQNLSCGFATFVLCHVVYKLAFCEDKISDGK